MVDSVCVIVLNYNGIDLLPRVVPGIVALAEDAPVPTSICVVDNSSSDESVEWLQRNCPDVEVIDQPNRFLFSINGVVGRLSCSHLLILNNDIIPEPDALDKLIMCMDSDQVFAVSPKLLCWDKETLNSGRRMASYINGFFHHWQSFGSQSACPTLFPIGGALLVRRDRFMELGGFDDLYWPYFYEDVDLGYQAWARGWRVIYQPDAVMYHKTSASMSVYETDKHQCVAETANNLLCTWKNADSRTIRIHAIKLLRRTFGAMVHGDTVYLQGILRAGCRLGAVLKRRAVLGRQRIYTDEEIMLSACSTSAYTVSLADTTDA